MLDSIISYLNKTHEKLQLYRQRIAIAVHVEKDNENLTVFISSLPYQKKLVISSLIDGALAPEKSSMKLGEEYDLVIFDARLKFHADALGIISGVLRGGGCLVILLPEEQLWKKTTSPYLLHINKLLAQQEAVYYVTKKGGGCEPVVKDNRTETDLIKIDCPFMTSDQQYAVNHISLSIKQKHDYCGVLIAGRGRGKSSALGFIAANIISDNSCKVLITAPRLSVADPLFLHLQEQCTEGVTKRGSFKYKNSAVSFIAPDLLLEEMPFADVLFVDEAAAIPISMLVRLLATYPKIIFSSTTHGYEGTGRGFILKFYKLLDNARINWQKIELHQPVRWSQYDPLEKWIEELLFLNIKPDSRPALPEKLKYCTIELINRGQIPGDMGRLSSIFSLLIFAHYRTRPSDFQYLLESENIRIYSLEYKNQIMGVLVINQEGDFSAELSTAIYRGERRPKGNLLAQTLCFHAGSEYAARLVYARIMRIAVHPEIQQLGFGSYLLEEVIKQEQKRGIDIIGSSFSATLELIEFWNKSGMSLLRSGFSRDHVTASFSVVVAKALSKKGHELVDELAIKFKRNIKLWMESSLSGLSEDIKQYMLNYKVECSDKFTQDDMRDVVSFICYNRNYEACMPAITRWFNSFEKWPAELSSKEIHIIELSQQYMSNWKEIAREMGFTGKSEAFNFYKSALSHLLKIKQQILLIL